MRGWRRFHNRRPKKCGRGQSSGKKLIAPELAEGTALRAWCVMMGYPFNLLFHIANEGSSSVVRGKQKKAEGIVRGVADYCLPISCHGYHALYIELKASNGQPTDEQLLWCRAMIEVGNMARIVWTWPAAATVLAYYVGDNKAIRFLPEY